MLENNRDEINYHKFLKSVRKSQKISLERTAFGICSKSDMSRIEGGTRLPSKLVRDRLTARLGISGEEYEEYLIPKEYEQWQARMEIIRCINKKDIEGAEEKIKYYESQYEMNKVEKQFVETMKFMVFQMKGFSDWVLCTQAYNAMICTIPDMDAAFNGAQLLADQELNLIMEYVRLYVPKVSEKDAVSWKLKQYDKIANYVEHSRMDGIARAKVYSKLACFVSELVLNKCKKEEQIRYALELCTRAIEALRDRYRLYYFVELNEYRKRLTDKLCTLLEDSTEETALKELGATSTEWAKLFVDLYTKYELPVYMENFTYLYVETECNNISEVIRIRRNMMGMPRIKFCANACDERTLFRIEKGEIRPTMAVLRDLLERAGLCAEYKRARVITSNRECVQRALLLLIEMNTGKYEKAVQTHRELCMELDMGVVFNEQEMRRAEGLILRGLGKISKQEHSELLIDAIECTVSLDCFKKTGEIYLSANELECVHNFVAYTDGELSKLLKIYCEDICNDLLLIEEFETSCLTKYEMIMNQCANYIGNAGDYEMANLISDKLLKESLRNRRLLYVINCVYNELWTQQKRSNVNDKNIDENYAYPSLKDCLLLSDISKKEDWKIFFQQKIQ